MLAGNTGGMDTPHNFAMFTDEGNVLLGEIAEQFLGEWAIISSDIDQVVVTFERYIESQHEEFAAKHGEYSDTAVRDELHKWFTRRLTRPNLYIVR